MRKLLLITAALLFAGSANAAGIQFGGGGQGTSQGSVFTGALGFAAAGATSSNVGTGSGQGVGVVGGIQTPGGSVFLGVGGGAGQGSASSTSNVTAGAALGGIAGGTASGSASGSGFGGAVTAP